MRLSLFAFATLVALTASGCDSNGIDTIGGDTGGGTTHPGGGGTGGGTGGGGTTAPRTFAGLNPAATYLRTDRETPSPEAFLLSEFGIEPGEDVCFRTVGDFNYAPGVLASTRTDTPVATGVFSASSSVSSTSERTRIKDAIDSYWDIVTRPVLETGNETNIDEDFEVTNNCWTVPAGARYFFLSAYDDLFQDNTDANAGGQPFGVIVAKR